MTKLSTTGVPSSTDSRANYIVRRDANAAIEVSGIALDTDSPTPTLRDGETRWNPIERTTETAVGNNVTGQHFHEEWFHGFNGNGHTIPNGTVVAFAGVEPNTAMPYVAECAATATFQPFLTVGVTTEDIPVGEYGKITWRGDIRDIDTTGTAVGETWQVGDLLYMHPTTAGALTKVKPTAPHPAISIAAVEKAHATLGKILVRPTLATRLFYGVFSDTTNQTHSTINTPKAITFNTTDFASGFSRGTPTSRIIAGSSGLYNFQFSLEVTKSSSNTGYVWIWVRKNGTDEPNSATKLSIASNSAVEVPAWNFILSMVANDYFELMWAVDDTKISLSAPAATAFCPAIPSAILTVSQINQ